MTILTKSTITTYQGTIYDVSEDFLNEMFVKSEEMQKAGKTANEHEFMDDHKIRRYWLDQSAVDEWITFLTDCSEKYSFVIADILVEDASIPI
jgi:hypothetical protein